MKFIKLYFLPLIFLLQGCVATLAVTSVAFATKVATDPRTTSEQINDTVLENDVAKQISNFDKEILRKSHISIVAYSGILLIVGQVPEYDYKNQIIDIANNFTGIKQVIDEITVGENISLFKRSKDTYITTAIKSKLFLSNQVKSTDVKIITEDAVVYLMGNLTKEQTNSAVAIARAIAGVKKVVIASNEIE